MRASLQVVKYGTRYRVADRSKGNGGFGRGPFIPNLKLVKRFDQWLGPDINPDVMTDTEVAVAYKMSSNKNMKGFGLTPNEFRQHFERMSFDVWITQ
jgi:hypothetical protein